MTLFSPLEIERQHNLLAHHMPVGRVWAASFDRESNVGKMVAGLSVEFYRLQLQTEHIETEMDIDQTLDLIEEWERSVSIPNKCFGTNVDIETRRLQVRQIFSNFGGVQKGEDFTRVASVFGYDARITPGVVPGSFPLTFPIPFFDSTRSATHTFFVEILDYLGSGVEFPLEFPIKFSDGGTSFLQCIFNVLAPANVSVVFVPEDTI